MRRIGKVMPLLKAGTLKRARACTVAVAVVAALASASGVAAQTVDYGNLQELFGEPVTTSATGKPQKASDAPVALEIVTADEIRRMGVTSLPEVLNKVPGLASWQSTRAFADVGVRGQNTAYNPTLLVLLNGRQVYIDIYGYADWSLIPAQLEEIRQIEVVKGPTTALYGFNAVSGVVNIVTYNPKYDDVSQAGVAGGIDHYGRGYAYKTLKFSDDAQVRFSGSLERFDEFDARSKTAPVALSTFQDADNRKLLADGLIQLAENTQLRLEGSYAKAEGSEFPPNFTAALLDKRFWSGKASLVSDTSAGLIEANLYTNVVQSDYSGSVVLGFDNRITTLQFQDLFKIGTDHTFRLQTEFRHNGVKGDEFIGSGAELSYDVLAAGGMWNWAIGPQLEWTNALRVDHLMLERDGPLATTVPFASNSVFNQDITAYSANSGIVWKVTDLDTLRASYGRGIQAPSLTQFGLLFAAGGLVFAGNPTLDPVVVQNYEIGYDRIVAAIAGKFRSSLFYKRSRDISAFGGSTYLSGATFISQVAPISDSDTAGLELGLEGKIGSAWSWDMSYIYQTTNDDFTSIANAVPSTVSTHYEDTLPHHVFKGHLGYAAGPWETDLYGEAASDFDAVVGNAFTYTIAPLDGYYTLGGRVAYNFENDLTLALSGSELTQARVANNYGLENERRLFLTLSKKF